MCPISSAVHSIRGMVQSTIHLFLSRCCSCIFLSLVFSCTFPCHDLFQATIHTNQVLIQMPLTHSQRYSPQQFPLTAVGERRVSESDTNAAQALTSLEFAFHISQLRILKHKMVSEVLGNFLSKTSTLMSSSFNRPRACSQSPTRPSHLINQSLKSRLKG